MKATLMADHLHSRVNSSISRETDAAVGRPAESLGVRKEDVFSLALALLSIAVEAKMEGNRVAVDDPAGGVVSEITGIGPESL